LGFILYFLIATGRKYDVSAALTILFACFK
jgi:hypothetical protein